MGLNRGTHEGKEGIWYREWGPGAKVTVSFKFEMHGTIHILNRLFCFVLSVYNNFVEVPLNVLNFCIFDYFSITSKDS